MGTFALPRQRQGEGLSVGPGGRLRISTEGVGTAVQQVALPPEIARAMRAPDPAAAGPSTPPPSRPAEDTDASSTWLAWSLAGAAVLVAVGVALGLTRRPA